MEPYTDCWIALTADDPERKASTVSVVALALSSIMIYINNLQSIYRTIFTSPGMREPSLTLCAYVFSFTWSWTRNWKFDSCSICVSYSFFFFRHWIAAETNREGISHTSLRAIVREEKKKLKSYKIKDEKHHKLRKNPSMLQAQWEHNIIYNVV